jgi:thermopsin
VALLVVLPGVPTVIEDARTAAISPHGLAGGSLEPTGASPAPLAMSVDPFHLISSEPAPMGVADFGVPSAGGTGKPYSYSTPWFQGSVEVRSMLTTAPGQPSGSAHYMTFQLNTVLVLRLGSTNYSYWIQDVVSIDSSTRFFGMIDNIWNLSSPSAALASVELRGNGSVNNVGSQSWYADAPGSTIYPGNLVYLTWPATISVRVFDSEIAGFPQVGFEYNDGYGWVTYDNVTFEHMSRATNFGFVVNGYSYTPLGVFYDAEWVYAGSGSGQYNNYSNLNMSLEFWNGHNLQSPWDAWNFGSDTAESLSNVVSALGASRFDGRLYSHLTNGSGSLGLLYNSSDIGLLNISAPTVPTGAITVNGTGHGFVGGSANLTLAPGTYSIGLYNGSTLVDSTLVTIAPGSYTPLTLPLPRVPVHFHETGLPARTSWSVTLGAQTLASTGVWINFTERNGTYLFTTGHVSGYVTPVTHGTLPIVGSAVQIDVPFWTFNFTVTFQGINVPGGTGWSVRIDGTMTHSSTSAPLSFALGNGTHTYAVDVAYAYVSTPSSGTFQVRGQPILIQVSFTERLGVISGSISPAEATLRINGAVASAPSGFFNFSESPATYSIEATASGYIAYFSNLTVTAGNVSYANITMTTLPPAVPGSTGLLNSPWLWVGIAALAVSLGAAGALILRRQRGRPAD